MTVVRFNLPEARSRHQLVYNKATAKTLIFGGTNGTPLDASWEHDGVSWTEVATAEPTAREYHAMVYDDLNNRAVLFGGYDGALYLNDTWVFTTAWSQLVPGASPTARSQHAMAWDGAQVLLFGGHDGSSYLADTWSFNGTLWTLLSPATTPPARRGHRMAYDPVKGVVVLFGGYDGALYLNDTWEFDGTDWTLVIPSVSPTVRAGHTMAWDETHDRLLLFGGDQDGAPANDLWEWNGSNWRALATLTTPPSARQYVDMAYDGERFLLFGGYDGANHKQDVWEYRSTSQWRGAGFSYNSTLVEVDTGARLVVPYSTTNPVIFTEFFFTVDGIASFATDGSATAPDELRFYLIINNQPKWWNGTAWGNSDGSFARSNTLQDVVDHIASLALSASKVQLAVALHSDAGTTSPEILSITLDLSATQPAAAPPVIINNPMQNPLSNQVVYMSVAITSQSSVATVLEVTLISVGPLSTTSTQYITSNHLEKEILSKAGLDSSLTFSTLTEISTATLGDRMVYYVEITVA